MADVMFKGPMVGRFFRLSSGPEGSSLVEACSEYAAVEDRGVGSSFYRAFCRGVLPNDGQLGEDPTELAYRDGGSGVWRFWLREETRTASRGAIHERALRIAMEEDEGTPLDRMQPRERKDMLERARRELLRQVVPSIRILPAVVVDDWLWIGGKGTASDRTYIHLLRNVFGPVEPDPLLWSDTGFGWTTCSYATLQAFIQSKAGELAPDVVLSSITIKGRSIQVRAADGTDASRAVVKQVAKTSSESAVKTLSFEVQRDGTPILVEVDMDGVFRGEPMKSFGGLPQERIRRRFDDVRYAAARLKELMAELVAQAEEEP
jgi:hypothetical protein